MNVFGDIWNFIVAALNWVLQGLYGWTGNYGIAIILLTVFVKLILLPLTIKQTRSMIAMQSIQPEIRKLQEKYKDDKEKLSQEMMKFYKENKVNPLGGCLPLILQMPIFFALFTVLRKYLLTPPTMLVGNTYTVFSAHQAVAGYSMLPFIKTAGFLWIDNLADSTRIADPYYVLPILLAVTTWFSQKQVMTDPRQKTMLYIMPLIMLFFALSLPAGVVLYWVTTNALQILQQFGMEYYDKKHPQEAPKFKEEKEKRPPPERAAEKERAPVKGQLVAKAREQSKGKAPAKTAEGGPKAKPAAGQKGKPAPKQQPPSSSKGGKASPQVRKPKGPPPQQKKQPRQGASGKGGARKK